jgi:dCTP deaminase
MLKIMWEKTMIKNDIWIKEMSEKGMITPFESQLVRRLENVPVISYGLSSFGYDIRLSPKEFRVFRHIPGTVVDPKNFNSDNLEPVKLHNDENGSYFILPSHSYGLGVALERLDVPENITVLCIGKSTLARCGIIANLTPAEACMSDDTEILTLSGWKLIKDVIIGELALTFNPNTKQSEYLPIVDRQKYYFNGDLLHFHSKFIDQLVTPNHKLWVGKRQLRVGARDGRGRETKILGERRKGENVFTWELQKAHEIYGQWNYYLSRDIQWEGSNSIGETITFESSHWSSNDYVFKLKDWLTFIGCWLGDGSAFSNGNGDNVIKLAVVTKDKKRAFFRELLGRMKIKFSEGESGFEFRSHAVCEYLKPYCGAHNKRIPREYMNLPSGYLQCILDGLMSSDGHLPTCTYSTVSVQLIKDFQELCLKIGYNCTTWEKDSTIKGYSFHSFLGRYSNANKTPCKIDPVRHQSKVPYSGFVYDVSVPPNHVFMSRRNGRCSWTGNSWRGHLTLEFSNSSGADCRIYANEGVAQLLFLEGEPCNISYKTRQGKYQDQPEKIIFSKV